MLEFLVALLIFSTGMLGLMSTQLAGKRANHTAAQRSVATALARDIVERMRVNPQHASAYQVESVGDAGHRLPQPDLDCDRDACTAEQLVGFDLWQWESRLLGDLERGPERNEGGLVSPRACIGHDDGAVTVTVSWLALALDGQSMPPVCNEDAAESGDSQSQNTDSSESRSHIQIVTYVGGR